MDTDDLTVLCAPNSAITQYARYLEIEEDLDEWQQPWLNKLLPDLLPLFSAVESLEISQVKWGTLTFEAKDSLHTFSRRLKTLKLYGVEFDTLDEPLELISSAPLLEYLLLGSIECMADGVSIAEFTVPPLKQIIFWADDYEPALFDWLCGGQPAKSVSFGSITMKFIPSISAYLRVLGPALENLTFRAFKGPDALGTLCKEIDLAQNPSLRFISFDSLIGYLSPAHDPGWIVDVLSKITSPFIERVTIGVFLHNLEMLALLNFSALDALLADKSTVFSKQPTRLLFRISGVVDKGEAKTAIRKSLHHLDAQGRLSFTEVF